MPSLFTSHTTFGSLLKLFHTLCENCFTNCMKNEKFRDLFPLNQNKTELRSGEKIYCKICQNKQTAEVNNPSITENIEQTEVNIISVHCDLYTMYIPVVKHGSHAQIAMS